MLPESWCRVCGSRTTACRTGLEPASRVAMNTGGFTKRGKGLLPPGAFSIESPAVPLRPRPPGISAEATGLASASALKSALMVRLQRNVFLRAIGATGCNVGGADFNGT
ncbi:hypothetical protein GCM10009715_30230 [Paeniglutamicibacter psychrophenolicus]